MILTGVVRLGRDAEPKVTANGTPVVSFSGAYNYGRKGEDGNRPSQWVAFEFFGQRAEKISQYLTKGSQVWVAASNVRVREYTKKDGTVGVALEATVQDLDLVGSRSASDAQPAEVRKPAPVTKARFDQIEDDLPF